jgi:hypothetical protein
MIMGLVVMPAAILAMTGPQALTWGALGACGILGLLALVSPPLFQRVAAQGAHWFDAQKWIERLDRRYDVDHYVLPHCRVLGALVIASVVFLGGLLYRHWL